MSNNNYDRKEKRKKLEEVRREKKKRRKEEEKEVKRKEDLLIINIRHFSILIRNFSKKNSCYSRKITTCKCIYKIKQQIREENK